LRVEIDQRVDGERVRDAEVQWCEQNRNSEQKVMPIRFSTPCDHSDG
jgi:hypothetical protein